MRRHKKLMAAVVLASVLLFASLGGIALADDGDDGPEAKFGEFIDRVCTIYADKSGGDTIDNPEALKEALAEARTEMAKERASMRAAAMENHPKIGPEAMQERLDALLAEGEITQEQYDRIIERWESMPEDLLFGPGFRGPGGFRGMGGPCAPEE